MQIAFTVDLHRGNSRSSDVTSHCERGFRCKREINCYTFKLISSAISAAEPESNERFRASSSSYYYLQYALHMRSIIYCFGGMCAAASTILVVAIAKFGSYDKNRDKKQHA